MKTDHAKIRQSLAQIQKAVDDAGIMCYSESEIEAVHLVQGRMRHLTELLISEEAMLRFLEEAEQNYSLLQRMINRETVRTNSVPEARLRSVDTDAIRKNLTGIKVQ